MAIQSPRTDSIFWGALAIKSAEQRAAYLDQACGTDLEFRAEVEALLIAHPKAEQFLESPPNPVATIDQPSSEGPGAVIGPYKVLEQLGEGGFGIVYMAEQQQPVRRKVALKVLKPGMDTRQVVARFEAERQALAIMDHPNIAKVFDGGATASGRPYFVMELVKGLPVTEFCDQNQLTPRQRLELFVCMCQAVQHAHQKGIIHRDLKPSNVLVTVHDTTPVVKVIDFGVAKALGQELTEKTLFTGFAQMVGTPLYMSPEQAGQSGLDIDTRSDIYSLGVLLYELLTGTTPFDKERLKGASYDELRRIIREEEPPKPSTRVSTLGEAATTASVNRQSDPRRLSRLFRGELDWIVMKALEKDRNRRYETASNFAADVQRYLNDEPVTACPPSAAYRLQKFVRRNKAGLTMTAVIALAILLVVGSLGWMVRDRADRQLRLAARARLVLDEVQRLEEKQKWPEALAAAERAQAVVAGGQAGTEIDDAVRAALRDLQMLKRLDAIHLKRSERHDGKPDHAGAVAGYAKAFRDYGADLERLPKDEAVSRLRKHSQIVLPLAAAIDDYSRVRRLAFGKSDPGWLSLVSVARGLDPDPVRNRLRASLGRRLGPDLQAELRALAESIDVAGQPPATLGLLGETLSTARLHDLDQRLRRRAQERYPGDFWINYSLAFSLLQSKDFTESVRFGSIAVALRQAGGAHNNLGLALYALKRLDEAEACFRRAIDLDRRDAVAHSNLGVILHDRKKLDEAEACYRRAIELEPTDASFRTNLGGTLTDQNKLDEAEACTRRAIELDPKFAMAHDNLGEILRRQKKLEEAEAACRRALQLNPNFAKAWLRLGVVLADRKKLEEAEACCRRGLELNPNSAFGHTNLGHVLRLRKKLDEAEAACRRAIELDPTDAYAHTNLGHVLRDGKKLDEAEASCRRAIELGPTAAVAHRALGSVLRDRKKLDQAEASYRRAIELDPTDAVAYRNLGNVLTDQGKLGEAEAAVRRAIELNPTDAVAHNNLGNVLRDQNKLEEAEAAVRRAVELDPMDAVAHSNLAVSLLRQNRLDEAEATVRRSLGLDPAHGRAYAVLGDVLYQQKKLDEAEASYRRAIELDPEDATAHGNLGALLSDQNKLDEAEGSLRRAIELDPSKAAGHITLGGVLGQQNRLDEAEVCLRRAIELDPQLAMAHNNLGAILRRRNQLDQAEICFRRALALDPRLAMAHSNLGRLLYDQHKLDEAEACLRRAIELEPDNPSLHGKLGDTLYDQKKLDEAEARYRRAIELDPTLAIAHNHLGVVLGQRNRQDEAEACLRRAIELDPQNAAAHNNLGFLLRGQKKLDQAEACYRRAIELAPTDPIAHGNLGLVLSDQKKLDEAEACYRRAIELNPTLALARNALGDVLRDQKKLDEAKACYRRAIELDPSVALFQGNLGNTLYELGQRDEAIAAFREAIRLGPNQALNHYYLGFALGEQDKVAEAAACFRRVVELQPGFAPAYEMLGKVLWQQQEFAEALAACEKFIELEPQNAGAHNDLAWYLATCPQEGLRDVARAVELASKAIALDPRVKGFRNTLGVAHYRAGHWMAASEELERSLEELGDNAADGFFLAMAHWQMEKKADARQWYDKAVEWMDSNAKDNEELTRFRTEAKELLGLEPKKD